MREFHPNPDQLEVPDPYYGGDDSFDDVFRILDESIDHFMEHLKSEHNIYV
jgi:protein-tyrosine phosphatase